MPAGSGRKVCSEWLEVTKLPDESNKVQCNHCGTKISSKIERIRSHLNKCNKVPLSRSFVSTELDEDAPSNHSRNADREVEVTFEGNSRNEKPCAKRQRTMKDFTVITTDNQKSNLDLKVANFFYGNNIAFNAAKSTEYKDMMMTLRPGYSGPSSSDLGGKLLDTVSDDMVWTKASEKSSMKILQ